MNKKLIILAALISSSAFATEYTKLQNEKSKIEFSFKQMDVKMDGKFKKINGEFYFDDKSLDKSKVNLNVDISSISMESKDTEKESLGKDWFNVKSFPTANFKISSIKLVSGNKYEATGKLNIKSMTKDVVFPLILTKDSKEANFNGEVKINRIDFKIGDGVWLDTDTIASDVNVKFNITLSSK